MILYLDSSSLVKLYVEEPGAQELRSLADEAEIVVISTLAYPEARSAFARQRRDGLLSSEQVLELKAALDRDWTTYLALEITPPVWREAGELTERHALRALDSLQLASYLSLLLGGLGSPVRFSSFDDRLNAAVEAEVGLLGLSLRE